MLIVGDSDRNEKVGHSYSNTPLMISGYAVQKPTGKVMRVRTCTSVVPAKAKRTYYYIVC